MEENGMHEMFFTSDGYYNYTEGLNGLDTAPFYTGELLYLGHIPRPILQRYLEHIFKLHVS
jgi:hypothetical protein